MKAGSIVTALVALLIALAVGTGGGYWYGHQTAAAAEQTPPGASASPPPVAAVRLALAREQNIAQTLTAYGTIVPQADAQQAVTAPLDVRVERLLVAPGEAVQKGAEVAVVAPSPDMHLAYVQARDALTAAQLALKNTQQRYDMKLATTQDLEQARTAVKEAQVRLDDLVQRSANRQQTLQAPQAGVVGKIDVQLGQVASAGTPLLWIDDPTRVEARLGVVPEGAQLIAPGQALTIAGMTQTAAPVSTTVTAVAHAVDADTHLVAVRAALPVGHAWLLGAPIRARITTEQKKALVVPRQAVLPQDGHETLYTVQGQQAVAHAVTIGLQNDQVVEVAAASPPLQAGDAVVVEGNYELADAMAVKVVGRP